jgi:cytochrome c oxidase subunit 1/cytochrome c oxidase subunit I+III
MPEDSYAPFWLALFGALFFAALGLRSWTFAVAMIVASGVSIIVWLRPRRALLQRAPARAGGE